MGKQYNKEIKRSRRKQLLKRRKEAGRATGTGRKPAGERKAAAKKKAAPAKKAPAKKAEETSAAE